MSEVSFNFLRPHYYLLWAAARYAVAKPEAHPFDRLLADFSASPFATKAWIDDVKWHLEGVRSIGDAMHAYCKVVGTVDLAPKPRLRYAKRKLSASLDANGKAKETLPPENRYALDMILAVYGKDKEEPTE